MATNVPGMSFASTREKYLSHHAATDPLEVMLLEPDMAIYQRMCREIQAPPKGESFKGLEWVENAL